MLDQKSRRCFHRVMSGLERGGQLRFLTLTSAQKDAPRIHAHFRALIMRLKRRELVKGYIQVPERTKQGHLHKHILFRGSYIEQQLISRWWAEIHGAKVVYIQKVRQPQGKRPIASYMAKYMSKEGAGRYSWDWGWVWKGFVKDWNVLKHRWRQLTILGLGYTYQAMIGAWKAILKHGHPPKWRTELISA